MELTIFPLPQKKKERKKENILKNEEKPNRLMRSKGPSRPD